MIPGSWGVWNFQRKRLPQEYFRLGNGSGSLDPLDPMESHGDRLPASKHARVKLLDGQNSVFLVNISKMKSYLDQFGTFRCSPLHFGGTTVFEPITRRAVATPHPSNQAPHAQSSASNNLRLSATTNRAPMKSGHPLDFLVLYKASGIWEVNHFEPILGGIQCAFSCAYNQPPWGKTSALPNWILSSSQQSWRLDNEWAVCEPACTPIHKWKGPITVLYVYTCSLYMMRYTL